MIWRLLHRASTPLLVWLCYFSKGPSETHPPEPIDLCVELREPAYCSLASPSTALGLLVSLISFTRSHSTLVGLRSLTRTTASECLGLRLCLRLRNYLPRVGLRNPTRTRRSARFGWRLLRLRPSWRCCSGLRSLSRHSRNWHRYLTGVSLLAWTVAAVFPF